MFDIGFSEIVVIAVVALIVIGPEKLPKTARTAGLLFGRLQRYVNDVKADINREIELDELRKLQQQMKSAVQEIETSVTSATQDLQTGIRSVESELNSAAADAPPAAGASETSSAVTEVTTSKPQDVPVPSPVAAALAAASTPTSAEVPAPTAPTLSEPEAPAATSPAPADAAEPPRQASLPGFERG